MRRQSVTRSRGNVYADAGFPDPEADMAKAEIVMAIGEIIERRRLTQKAAATLMGLSQPDVSKLLRGIFDGYSLERLFRLMRALGSNVNVAIKITPTKNLNEGQMTLSVNVSSSVLQ
jgi:predicted XRE-type DNA-binding protein